MSNIDMDLTDRIITFPQKDGSAIMAPFVMATDVAKENHIVCWLEWCDGEFDPAKAARSAQPQTLKHNRLESFMSLPQLDVSIDGVKRSTFRAICDRSIGGKIGSIKCDGGTLWTVLPLALT